MTSPFQQPGKGGDLFSPRNHPEWIGRLFLFYPEAIQQKVFDPSEGPKDFVLCDAVVLDLPDQQTGQPTFISGTLVGGKGLVPNLSGDRLGKMVLGRLTKQPDQGQKSGAYVLSDFTSQDEAFAKQYHDTHPREVFKQPAAQAPPQQQAWGQAPAAAPLASPQLPYDMWQNTQGAAPAGPTQQQWGASQSAPAPALGTPAQAAAGSPAPQWGAPAASAQAAPAPTAPASPSAVDAATLAAFLTSKQVPVQSMTEDQVRMIASTYPDCPQPGQPPF